MIGWIWHTPTVGLNVRIKFYGGHHRQISYRRIFSVWDILKKLMYRDAVTTQKDEIARLHAACTSVDPKLQ
ncbi:hypothetical protein TNCV_1404401 [Trichonephila clavipes]|nr:hypothetical protein TNCV_1404401 [Trichonephila clavipes]